MQSLRPVRFCLLLTSSVVEKKIHVGFWMVSFDANPSQEDCVSICPRSIANHAPIQPKVDFI